MLELSSIVKIFPGVNGRKVMALDNICLEIIPGDFLTLIGPSGSGKSTLLFTIGGLLKPTSGEVNLFDTEIYSLAAAERATLRRDRIGFVFQTFNLVSYLTSLENVALPAVLAGARRSDAIKRAGETLERLGLSDRLNHHPPELSVGERQRVALCRSIINRPDIILADEPTGNLDPAMSDEVMDIFLELNASGQTIVMATHDHRLAELGKRVVAIENGRTQNKGERAAGDPGA